MKTDLDHLHHVFKNRPSGRHTGKTFARCHELAAAVGLGDTDIACEISYYQDLCYLRDMISSVFKDLELDLVWVNPNLAQSGNTTIRFISSDNFDRGTRGRRCYTFVPMRHQD